MKKILKIVLVITAIFIAVFLATKISVSFFGSESKFMQKSFSVKNHSSLSSAIFLSLTPKENNGDKLPEKINFLLLGKPGEGNDAPHLTDTIIFGTLKTKERKIYLFSFPRDLYMRIEPSIGGQNFAKINSLYEIGKSLNREFPANLIISSIEKITGEKTDYFISIDLFAVKKIVDDLDGLNVNVSETINDQKFPSANNGYETFRVEKGWRFFDGETTLKYLRTRHSQGGDFDRMRRQQDIVEAFRKKIFGMSIFWDFPKIIKIYSQLQNHTETNMSAEEIQSVYSIIKNIAPENLVYRVVDSDNTGLMLSDNIFLGDNLFASIVKPKKGLENYDEIRDFIKKTVEN